MKDTMTMCLSVLILCSLFIAVTEAKFCYQCADAKTDGECFKMENYEAAWRFGTNYTYYALQNITHHDNVKNCTHWGGMCYNEHIKEPVTDGLMCYGCSDSRVIGQCQTDSEGMITQQKNFKHTKNLTKEMNYLKNCTADWGDKCVIEHIKQRDFGDDFIFLRGCTDGKLFFATDFPREDIPADNQTTCAFRSGSGNIVSCITLCQSDFCNGPQVTEGLTNRATKDVKENIILYHCALLLFLLTRYSYSG